MKTSISIAVGILCWGALWPAPMIGASPASAQTTADYRAELMEWVYEPCMEIGAALAVKSMDKEARKLGVKRRQIVQLMLATREQGILDFAKTLAGGKKKPNWEARRTFYPPLLRVCIAQQLKEAE